MACAPLTLDPNSAGGGFVTGVLGFLDCQARTLGASGYQALAAPGSIVSLMLTGLLTLFVAGYGFRMLMGETPALRDGVGAIAKIAFVLALATAWAPYRTLVYDVTLRGPAELAGAIGGASLPGSGGDLAERLDLVDQALVQLNDLGVGRRGSETRTRQVVGSQQVIVEPAQGAANPIEPFAFGLSRLFFLVGAVGAFGVVRLVAGLLLALGPLFVAFALFDSTRGLFEGWVRGLAGTFLGGIATVVVLASELALIEGWIADIVAQRLANAPIPGAAIALLTVTVVFDVILIAALAAATRVAAGFRLPAWRRVAERVPKAVPQPVPARVPGTGTPGAPAEPRTRALAVADGVAATQRREAAAAEAGRAGPAGGTSRAAIVASGATGGAPAGATSMVVAQPLGRSYQSRPRTRRSTSAGRRDARG